MGEAAAPTAAGPSDGALQRCVLSFAAGTRLGASSLPAARSALRAARKAVGLRQVQGRAAGSAALRKWRGDVFGSRKAPGSIVSLGCLVMEVALQDTERGWELETQTL